MTQTLDEIRDSVAGKPAEEVVRAVLRNHLKACMTCSFQAEDMVALHMALAERPKLPVLFLDTGYHFAETYAYRDRMAEAWGFDLVNVAPELTVEEQESRFGKLNQTDPTRCCQMRKVEPLQRALAGYDVWITGLRREQSPTRAGLMEAETQALRSGAPILKVNPLARWTNKDVWAYLRRHAIEPLHLYDLGFTSIGCEPCTALPADPDNPRSGRWGGKKLECGIHTFAQGG